jgi:hypothetical protein
MSAEAVVLAVASAMRPSTSLAALYTLLSKPRPRPLLAAFVAAGLLVSTAIGVLVVAGLHGVDLPGGESRFTDIVDIVAGIAALGFANGVRVGGIDRVRRRRSRDEPSWVVRTLRDPSPAVAAAVGVATHVPGLLYLVALNAIAADRPGVAEAVVDVLVYNAIWFSIPIAALVFARRRPTGTRAVVERVNAAMRRHELAILVAVFAAVGLFLTAKGVTGLVG